VITVYHHNCSTATAGATVNPNPVGDGVTPAAICLEPVASFDGCRLPGLLFSGPVCGTYSLLPGSVVTDTGYYYIYYGTAFAALPVVGSLLVYALRFLVLTFALFGTSTALLLPVTILRAPSG